MPVRFRRTFKILPGIKVNVSKHGVSVTVGTRGMHLTFNRFGVRQAVGLPGTGVSETSYLIGGVHKNKPAPEDHEDVHHGHGCGCELSGCGCLVLLLLLLAGLALFGSAKLGLHPELVFAAYWAQLWHLMQRQVIQFR